VGTAAQTRYAAAIRAAFPAQYRISTATVVRKIANSSSWSQHAYGNATDSYATAFRLSRLASWSVANARGLSVARVIYNRRVWESKGRVWRVYRGTNPHTTHVHTDFLPQWTGTPPGRPAGTTSDINRPYATPPARAAPYGRQWLRPIAFAMYGTGEMAARPEAATEVQVRAAVFSYRIRRRLGSSTTMSRQVWEQVSQTGIARRARGRRVENAQRMFKLYGVYPGIGIDGIFGPQTQSAVARFQQQAQVRVTGAVGVNDWNALWWGPEAWKLTDPGDFEIIDWERPPDRSPTGEIAHSWDGVLRWVGGRQLAAGRRANAAGRSMRNLIR
jgi:peptidoglycan hydrolase-like protein with peptidoglycan-binding domain